METKENGEECRRGLGKIGPGRQRERSMTGRTHTVLVEQVKHFSAGGEGRGPALRDRVPNPGKRLRPPGIFKKRQGNRGNNPSKDRQEKQPWRGGEKNWRGASGNRQGRGKGKHPLWVRNA